MCSIHPELAQLPSTSGMHCAFNQDVPPTEGLQLLPAWPCLGQDTWALLQPLPSSVHLCIAGGRLREVGLGLGSLLSYVGQPPRGP